MKTCRNMVTLWSSELVHGPKISEPVEFHSKYNQRNLKLSHELYIYTCISQNIMIHHAYIVHVDIRKTH